MSSYFRLFDFHLTGPFLLSISVFSERELSRSRSLYAIARLSVCRLSVCRL